MYQLNPLFENVKRRLLKQFQKTGKSPTSELGQKLLKSKQIGRKNAKIVPTLSSKKRQWLADPHSASSASKARELRFFAGGENGHEISADAKYLQRPRWGFGRDNVHSHINMRTDSWSHPGVTYMQPIKIVKNGKIREIWN